MASDFPPFVPHRFLRSGHAQTLAGAFLPQSAVPYTARQHHVELRDGDRIVLHEDCPNDWRSHDRSVVMLHGLGGSHASGYMQRIAHKLAARGVRAFRMDLRGCGAGVTLARLPYHSGRSLDAADVLAALERQWPLSPVTLVGFSLGANIVLKLLGELGDARCGRLDSAVAVCPPVDLAACSRNMSTVSNRPYDRYFVNALMDQVEQRGRTVPAAPGVKFARRPRTIWEFDDQFTAAVCGFDGADHYYRQSSSAPWVPHIRWPVLLLASRDDPLIPRGPLERIAIPDNVELRMTDHGGHLGFIGRRGIDPDRRWMDWRVVDWILARDRAARAPESLRSVSPEKLVSR